MVALRAGEVERFVARPDPKAVLVLVHGPDAGLVAERCAALTANKLGARPDPLSLVRLEGDDIAADPDRLLEEAHTIPLFGGERVIRVRLGGRAVQAALQKLLDGPKPEALVLVEAGDLKRTHAVRALCEKSRAAVTLPCYGDGAADLGRLVDQELADSGMSIAPEAKAALVSLLGADRLASRQELRKLALYAHGRARIEHADVESAVADATSSAADKAVDAAFLGDPATADAEFQAALRSGIAAGTVAAAALRQALQLARLVADPAGRRAALESASRSLPLQRRAALEKAMARWSPDTLDQAVRLLSDATLESRRRSDLASSVVGRALLVVAAQGRRAG